MTWDPDACHRCQRGGLRVRPMCLDCAPTSGIRGGDTGAFEGHMRLIVLGPSGLLVGEHVFDCIARQLREKHGPWNGEGLL